MSIQHATFMGALKILLQFVWTMYHFNYNSSTSSSIQFIYYLCLTVNVLNYILYFLDYWSMQFYEFQFQIQLMTSDYCLNKSV